MKYLLDTNTCIHISRGTSAALNTRIAGHPASDYAISAIVAAELWFGAARRTSPEAAAELERMLAPFRVVPFDEHAARRYGAIREALKRAGTPIGPNDLLIAAHALALGATLISSNVREFRRVRGLRVEDWAR